MALDELGVGQDARSVNHILHFMGLRSSLHTLHCHLQSKSSGLEVSISDEGLQFLEDGRRGTRELVGVSVDHCEEGFKCVQVQRSGGLVEEVEEFGSETVQVGEFNHTIVKSTLVESYLGNGFESSISGEFILETFTVDIDDASELLGVEVLVTD